MSEISQKLGFLVGTASAVLQSKLLDAVVWANGAQGVGLVHYRPQKATATSLCIHSTTQPLYQGAGIPEKQRRRLAAKKDEEHKVAGSIPESMSSIPI